MKVSGLTHTKNMYEKSRNSGFSVLWLTMLIVSIVVLIIVGIIFYSKTNVKQNTNPKPSQSSSSHTTKDQSVPPDGRRTRGLNKLIPE